MCGMSRGFKILLFVLGGIWLSVIVIGYLHSLVRYLHQ
jgi:hypothetical protein